VEIYIATLAGLFSSLLLGFVYLADRYEREPIELIQSYFLFGLAGQLVLILAAVAVFGDISWSGPWILVTVAGAAIVLPIQLHRQPEMDERFDGIVYSVAFVGGATCVIHINNLPRVIAASPYRDALASGAAPDLRDLLILAASPEFAAELGQGLVVILIAVLVGAVLGTLQLRGWPPWKTASACVGIAITATGFDLLAGGAWLVRGVLMLVAVAAAVAIKRRSVFKDRPEATERDVLILGVKTVLVIFGAVLLATVLLQAVVEHPDPEKAGNNVTERLQDTSAPALAES
jgi:hypothetical protein